MKKMMVSIAVLMIAVVSFAGTAGVTNEVYNTTPYGLGDNGLRAKVVEFNDNVVTKLNAMTTTDGIEPENLNSGTLPADVTLAADSVGTAQMADADHGDIVWIGGAASLDADVVAADEMANADHGDITWASGVASIDANVIGTNEMDPNLVTTSLSGVTNFDISIVKGVVTVFTKN